MTPEYLKEPAERCRRLAKGADPFTEKRLLDLAGEYDARITEIERGFRLSPASRIPDAEGRGMSRLMLFASVLPESTGLGQLPLQFFKIPVVHFTAPADGTP